jgi:hypothetical protein
MLVGFWFDGGLFNLPTAAMFWILLELGSKATQTSQILTSAGSRLSRTRAAD